MPDTNDAYYRAVGTRDTRLDGRIFSAVKTTGIYCRPSCPARTPKRENVVFFRTAAGAQAAGFRACRRCRPDVSPGNPDWNQRADLVARALRLISDGIADEHGVPGLARRLRTSERHLHRQMTAELGAGPLAIARMRRAQSARVLLESTDLRVIDVAYSAGYGSLRQFNASIQETYGLTPSELRRRRDRIPEHDQALQLRLRFRPPFAADALFAYLRSHAIPGIEVAAAGTYRRSMRLPHGPGVLLVATDIDAGSIAVSLELQDLRDLTPAVNRVRRLLDVDADPSAVTEALSSDEMLRPLVQARPGLRFATYPDGFEMVVRAVIGQRVSVARAKTIGERLVACWGTRLLTHLGGVTHVFPAPEALAEADLSGIGLSAEQQSAIRTVSKAVGQGALQIDPGADRSEVRIQLASIPGVGRWTTECVAMRGLGDPDAFPVEDRGLQRALESLGRPMAPSAMAAWARRFRPWRSYVAQHLWAHLSAVRLTSDTVASTIDGALADDAFIR